jgi:hypothetical protein
MKDDMEKVNFRHLRGFRRFQNAALLALSISLKALKGKDPEPKSRLEKEKAAVKVGDMKTLVSAYKEAVAGERMVLGMESAGSSNDWPKEMLVSWVDEDEQGAEDGGLEIS